MKKILTRFLLLLFLFAAAAGGVFWGLNRQEGINMINMESATLPVLYMMLSGERINCLHGYVDTMNAATMRDTITPLGEGRNLTLQIDTYGNTITELSYEIRSLDQKRLIEKTKVTNWSVQPTYVEATLNIENLIEAGEEYTLVLHVATEEQKTINYYTRIIEGAKNVSEKLEFVIDFSERTFDDTKSQELVKYLESSSQGDNTNFAFVNIHSSFSQITWGNLEVERITKPQIDILEINGNITSVRLSYQVQAENMYGTNETYDVTEFFRTRYTQERTFLLTYERSMNQQFLPVNENIGGSRINLGIGKSEDRKLISDEQGNITCFVSNGEVWYYCSEENLMRCIFSFYDFNDDGVRTNFDNHGIEPIKAEENGDVYFLVHGYMNRGVHEGKVGIALYHYSYEENIVKELLYIPYYKSADYLEQNLGDLFTISGESTFSFILEGTFYAVDFVSREYTAQVTGLKEGSYVISPSGNILAWQELNEMNRVQKIRVLLLDENREFSISAKPNEVLQVIGFIDEDMVYGTANEEDIEQTAAGRTICYMSNLKIIDKEENEVGAYHKDGYYFTEAEITSDNMITLKRFQKTEEETYVKAEEEYITNNASANKKELTVSFISNELKKKELGINLIKSCALVPLKTSYVNEIQSNEETQLLLGLSGTTIYEYYIYAKGGLMKASDNLTEAISLAYSEAGILIDNEGAYVWKRNNLYDAITLSDVSTGILSNEEEKSTLNLCLEAMMRKCGVMVDTTDMTQDKSIIEILNEHTKEGGLDLSGCSLDQVFYFVQTGRPVLGKLGEEYVLIVGYDSYNAVLLNAKTNERYRIGLADGAEEFAESGNEFVTIGE